MPEPTSRMRTARITFGRMASVAAVTAFLPLAGCGEEVDTESIVKDAREGVESAGVKVKSVKCPDDLSGDTGTKFECTVVTENGTEGKIPYIVREKDVALDEGGEEALAELLRKAGEQP